MATLTLVGLPIGNAQDITKRAYQTLEQQKVFFVEDTRNFKSLLGHYGLPLSDYRIESFHDHSQDGVERIIKRMDQGENIFLCSDAGSPMISDPAFPLVRAALDKGHDIETLPGVSSPVAALELAGLPPIPFTFWGFLPRKDQAKKNWFQELSVNTTHLCFESPVRLEETIELFYQSLGPAINESRIKIAVARELTKLYQETVRFDLSQWPEARSTLTFRGEMILLIYKELGTDTKVSQSGDKLLSLANDYMNKQTPRNLSKLLAGILGGKAGEYYDLLAKCKDEQQ